MSTRVHIELAQGRLLIGSIALACEAAGVQGELRVEGGRVFGTVSFQERTRLAWQALGERDPARALGVSLLEHMTLRAAEPCAHDEVVALALAGAGVDVPAYDSTLTAAASRSGLTREQLLQLPARDVDELARAQEPALRSIVFAAPASDAALGALRLEFSSRLLYRLREPASELQAPNSPSPQLKAASVPAAASGAAEPPAPNAARNTAASKGARGPRALESAAGAPATAQSGKAQPTAKARESHTELAPATRAARATRAPDARSTQTRVKPLRASATRVDASAPRGALPGLRARVQPTTSARAAQAQSSAAPEARNPAPANLQPSAASGVHPAVRALPRKPEPMGGGVQGGALSSGSAHQSLDRPHAAPPADLLDVASELADLLDLEADLRGLD